MKNCKYKIEDYVQVVNPHDGYERYMGRKGIIATRHFDADYKGSYEIRFDGDNDIDDYVWFEEEIDYCTSQSVETAIASENELLNLLS